MHFKRLSAKLMLALGSVGILASSSAAATLVLSAKGAFALTQDEDRNYRGQWYSENVLMYEKVFQRGEPVEYLGEAPIKTDYDGEKIYVFSGWDVTGDNVPDIPVLKAYSNFKANACFKTLPMDLLEKIDWEKLLEMLMDKNIDLEALLERLGLSPEDIAKLLKKIAFRVKSNQTGPAYLRTESFGDFNRSKKGWDDAGYYDLSYISPGSINPLLYTSNKLTKLSNNPLFASYCQQATYDFEYAKTGNKYPTIAFEVDNNQGIPSDSYSVNTISEEKTYSTTGYPLVPCTAQTVVAGRLVDYTNPIINEDEQEYRNYVREHYLSVDDEYKNFFLNLNNTVNASTSSVGDAVTTITNYFTNNYKINLLHNEFPKKEDPVTYFMTNTKEGGPNYFATAMTLYLRSLGYPARYTQGYVAAIEEPDTWTDVATLQAYSWCEVYVDGIGWMQADAGMYLLAAYFQSMGVSDEETMDMSEKGTPKQLIRLEAGPNTVYEKIGGGIFDYDKDLDLVAVFTDGEKEFKENVKPSYTIPVDISMKKGPYIVKPMAFYEYLTDVKYLSYSVDVLPLKVTDIKISNNNTYYQQSPINLDDFKFDVYFNDGQRRGFNSLDSRYFSHTPFPQGSPPGDYEVEFTYIDNWGLSGEFTEIKRTVTITIEKDPAVLYIEPEQELPTLIGLNEPSNIWNGPWTYYYDNGYTATGQYLKPEDIVVNTGLNAENVGEFTAIFQVGEDCEPYEYTFSVIENIPVSIESTQFTKTIYYINQFETEIGEYDAEFTVTYLLGNKETLNSSQVSLSYDKFSEEKSYDVNVEYGKLFPSGYKAAYCTYTVEAIYLRTVEVERVTSIQLVAGEQIDDAVLSNIFFYVTYNNDTDEYINGYYDKNRLSLDFTSVDINTPGTYNALATFTYSELVPPKQFYFKVHITGLKGLTVEFGKKPENFYTDHEYNIYDLEPTITAVFYDGEKEYSNEVDLTDPNLEVNFGIPTFSFSDASQYTLSFTYKYGNQSKTYSEIIDVLKRKAIDVTWDFGDIEGHEYKLDESPYFGAVTAEVEFNDDTTQTYFVGADQITYTESVVLLSTENKLYQHTLTFKLIVGEETFTKDCVYTSCKPLGLQIETNGDIFYDVKAPTYHSSQLEFSYLYYDGSTTPAYVDQDDATFSVINPIEVGANEISVEYLLDDDLLTGTYPCYFYSTYLSVSDPLHEDIKWIEGDYFDPLNLYYQIKTEMPPGFENASTFILPHMVDGADPYNASSGEHTEHFTYVNEEGITYENDFKYDVYVLTRLEINEESTFKLKYERGDAIDDLNTLLIDEIYTSVVTGEEFTKTTPANWITFSFEGYFDTSTLGNKNVLIKKTVGTHSATVTVNYSVVEPKVVSIAPSPSSETSVYESVEDGFVNQEFSDYIYFDVVYSNGLIELLDINEIYEKYTFTINDKNIPDPINEAGDYHMYIDIDHTYGENNTLENLPTQDIKYTAYSYLIKEIKVDISDSIRGTKIDDYTFDTTLYLNYQGGEDDEEFNLGNFTFTITYAYEDNLNLDHSASIEQDNLSNVFDFEIPDMSLPGDYEIVFSPKTNHDGGATPFVVQVHVVDDTVEKYVLGYNCTAYHKEQSEWHYGETDVLEGSLNISSTANMGVLALYKSEEYDLSDGSVPNLVKNTDYTIEDFDSIDLSTASTDGSYTSLTATIKVDDKSIKISGVSFRAVAKSHDLIEFNVSPTTTNISLHNSEALEDFIKSISVTGKDDFGNRTLTLNSDYYIVSNQVDIDKVGTYSVYVYLYDSVNPYGRLGSKKITVSVVDTLQISNVSSSLGFSFPVGAEVDVNAFLSSANFTIDFDSPLDDGSESIILGGGYGNSAEVVFNGKTYEIYLDVMEFSQQPDTSEPKTNGQLTLWINIEITCDGTTESDSMKGVVVYYGVYEE